MSTRTINLALQGGGALGALTWGVLDRLLEEPSIAFDGVSGSSAGAMNAVALGYGLTVGGRDGARQALESLWSSVGAVSYPPLDQPPAGLIPSPSKILLGLTRFFSPYQLNPFDINPLRSIVERLFDFERIRRECPIRLFVGTTHARSGVLRLFRTQELCADHLLASACLPSLNQAVLIDGEPYWDGGYAGNPALYPLLFECRSRDVMVVLLMPLMRTDLPTTADAIRARLTEIQFSATFMREVRGIAMARRFSRRSLLPIGALERRLLGLKFHLIDTDDLVSRLSVEKTLNTSLAFLLRLKEEGRARAGLWLEQNAGALNRRSTMDIEQLFDSVPLRRSDA
jgi:NTE family protein